MNNTNLKSLSTEQLEQIYGGVAPLVPIVIKGGGILIGSAVTSFVSSAVGDIMNRKRK